MTVYELSISNGYLDRATQTTASGSKRVRSGKDLESKAPGPAGPAVVTTDKNDLNRILEINDTFNTIASNIRFTLTAFDIIAKKVDRMHDRLKSHIKNYPPFLPGSEERVKFLKSFNTFRKQIDAMTFPPEYEFAKKIMADPAVVSGAGDWEVILEENGPNKIISSKEVHTGPTGLDIPELPVSADDVTIGAAIDRMENAKIILKQLKGDLSRDISELGRFKRQVSPLDDIPESTAESKIINVRRTLTGLPGVSLTAVPSHFTELLDN